MAKPKDRPPLMQQIDVHTTGKFKNCLMRWYTLLFAVSFCRYDPWSFTVFLSGGDDWQPDLVLDDGGDATHLLVNKSPSIVKQLKGVVECSVVGVHRLYQVFQILFRTVLRSTRSNLDSYLNRNIGNNFTSTVIIKQNIKASPIKFLNLIFRIFICKI